MLGIFEQTTASETVLHPHEDPEVKRLRAEVEAAEIPATHAQQAFRNYLAAHWQDSIKVPWPRVKQALSDRCDETAQVLGEVGRALDLALTAATDRATQAWDHRISQAFLDDLPTIEQFIAVLERHEQLAVEAEQSGVRRAISVSKSFITSAEMSERLAYAKKALNVD